MSMKQSSRKRRLWRLIVALFIAAVGATSIALVGSSQEGRPTGQSIQGVVVDDNGNGIAGADVVVRSEGESSAPFQVTTAANGGFVFNAPEAGHYVILARKTGFVGGVYGAANRGEPGLAVAVGLRQVVSGVTVKLRRGGVVSGTITDGSGRPVPGVSVSAIEQLPPSGGSRYVKALTVTTDDRGIFRLYGLQDGRYMIAALPAGSPGGRMTAPEWTRPTNEFRPDTRADSTQGDETLHREQIPSPSSSRGPSQGASQYAFVFYPGSLDPNRAQWISVAPGREVSDKTFALQLVTRAQVIGRMVTATGTEARNTQIALIGDKNSVFAALSPQASRSTVSPDGRFSFTDLDPGKYTIYARTAQPRAARGVPPPPADDLYGTAELIVGDEGFVTLDPIMMRRGAKVSGVVKFETGGKPAPAALTTSLRLISSNGVDMPTVHSDASDAFTFRGVPAGRYTIDAMVPTGSPKIAQFMWLKSVTRNGVEMLDTPFEITSADDVGDFVVTVSDRRTELSGRLLDGYGLGRSDNFVFVFPKDPARWANPSRFMRRPIRPASDGAFKIVGLPAGDYYLAALSRIDDNWHSDAGLQALVPLAIPITLADGQKRVQDMKIAR